MGKKTVVLAYSGGLDTSFCVKYLSGERGFNVHSVLVDTGGYSDRELEDVEKKAYEMGVEKHTTIHATQKLYDECIKYLVYGNILRNNTYPLSVSAERVFQALAIAEYAKKIKADAVAHGSTGAGNDQVRFDMIFNIMIPDVEIIAPIRDLKLSREAEISYLKEHGVELDWNKTKYSINQGIWGTSIGGKETLTSNEYLPEEAFPHHPEKKDPRELTLHFEKGELKGIGDRTFENPVDAIKALTNIASAYAIGRDIHVGDTIVGIKGRVGFEAPAPMIIIKSHHALEKHVLTKWQQYWKDQMGVWYGMMVHEGQFLEPVLRNIEKFLADTQCHVTGKVFVRLEPFRFTVLGIESSYDMMSPEFGTYGEMHTGWSGEDVKGFSKILSNQLRIYNKVKEKNGED